MSFIKKIGDLTTRAFNNLKKVFIKEKVVPEKIETPVEISRKPGLKCPECGTLISISIEMLLSVKPIYCTNCFLEINVDTNKSASALDALRTLKSGMQKAEEIKKSGLN